MKEKLSISFLCYEHQKPFTVTLSRLLNTKDKFKIETIVRTDAATGTAVQTDSVDIHKAPIDDLDFDGFFCPYCANRSFVRCGTCGAMSCLSKDWDRSKRLEKPCGHGGLLTGYIEEIDSRKDAMNTEALTGSDKGRLTAGGSASSWKG